MINPALEIPKTMEKCDCKSKTVRIEFANPTVKAIDYISDISKAVRSASKNLYTKHDVVISEPRIEYELVFVDLLIPRQIFSNFKVGNHLRGISTFLLKHDDQYRKYCVGTRLLYFIEY